MILSRVLSDEDLAHFLEENDHYNPLPVISFKLQNLISSGSQAPKQEDPFFNVKRQISLEKGFFSFKDDELPDRTFIGELNKEAKKGAVEEIDVEKVKKVFQKLVQNDQALDQMEIEPEKPKNLEESIEGKEKLAQEALLEHLDKNESSDYVLPKKKGEKSEKKRNGSKADGFLEEIRKTACQKKYDFSSEEEQDNSDMIQVKEEFLPELRELLEEKEEKKENSKKKKEKISKPKKTVKGKQKVERKKKETAKKTAPKAKKIRKEKVITTSSRKKTSPKPQKKAAVKKSVASKKKNGK